MRTHWHSLSLSSISSIRRRYPSRFPLSNGYCCHVQWSHLWSSGYIDACFLRFVDMSISFSRHFCLHWAVCWMITFFCVHLIERHRRRRDSDKRRYSKKISCLLFLLQIEIISFDWKHSMNSSDRANSSWNKSLQANTPLLFSFMLFFAYAIIFLIGLIANIFVIVVIIRCRRMRTLTNRFLLNLAVSDLLATLICLPPTAYHHYDKRWIFGEFLCRFVPFIQGGCQVQHSWLIGVQERGRRRKKISARIEEIDADSLRMKWASKWSQDISCLPGFTMKENWEWMNERTRRNLISTAAQQHS